MIKFLILSFLLSFPTHCFCKHKKVSNEKQIHQLAKASSDLFARKPSQALNRLQKVKHSLDPEASLSYVLSFIIFSEEAVAYDLMKNPQAALNSLNHLYPCIEAYNQKNREKDKPLSNKEDKKALELFQGIAYLAPSNEVQEFLLSFAHEMARQWRGLKLAVPSGPVEWEINYSENTSLEMCSILEKLDNFLKDLAKVLKDIYEILKTLKEIKDLCTSYNASINAPKFLEGSND